jgi:uncharacterized protein (DUF2141 family)
MALKLSRFLVLKIGNMKIRNLTLLLFFGTISTMVFSQHNLSLHVGGVKSDNGNVCFAIYSNESSFLKFDKVYKSGSQKAVIGSTYIEIEDLPDGDYAVAIFHDENGNKNLDTNMLGIPKEDIAFSKGKMKMFGPPKFDECAFTLNSNLKLTIDLE